LSSEPLNTPTLRLDAGDSASRRLWSEVGRLATQVLPEDWTLVGGLLVQLHAFEAGEADVRATTDVDILADARKGDRFQQIVQALRDDGFELQDPRPDEIGHRWERDGLVLDLLAPEGLKESPRVMGQIRTLQIPGGTQALARTEVVDVEIDGVACRLRRPTLLGAILMKARSLRVHADPDAQRADLVLLLSLVSDPRAAAGELRGRERNWLRAAADALGLDDPDRISAFPAARVRRARAAFRLMVET
jgi:hypothetical protein